MTTNVTAANIYNGQTIDSLSVSTGDILVLTAQTDEDENGVYYAGASATTKLTGEIDTINCGQAIEFFRATDANDTIELFHYIPKLLPEQMPDELLDMVIYYCAGRVLEAAEMFGEAERAFGRAAELMGIQRQGFKGEP